MGEARRRKELGIIEPKSKKQKRKRKSIATNSWGPVDYYPMMLTHIAIALSSKRR